jgi:hypothetical protein
VTQPEEVKPFLIFFNIIFFNFPTCHGLARGFFPNDSKQKAVFTKNGPNKTRKKEEKKQVNIATLSREI